MRRILLATAGLLAVLAGAVGPTGSASAADNNWYTGKTRMPDCDIKANAGVANLGDSVLRLYMDASNCDLMPRDAGRAPILSMHWVDNDHDWKRGRMPAAGGPYVQAGKQWVPEVHLSKQPQCHVGHRLTVDYYWTSFGTRTAAGSAPVNPKEGNLAKYTIKVVCGTGKKWT